MKTRHTPESAAHAVRAMFEADNRIAKTWDQYFEQARESAAKSPAQRPMSGPWLNSYLAAKLVQEQCGRGLSAATFEQASKALETVIPSLFAEYWEDLRLRAAAEPLAA